MDFDLLDQVLQGEFKIWFNNQTFQIANIVRIIRKPDGVPILLVSDRGDVYIWDQITNMSLT